MNVKKVALIGSAVVGLAMAIGCGTSDPPARQTITGTFVLHGSADGTVGNCRGGGGYDDVRPGMMLNVRDESGTIIGTGAARALADLSAERMPLVAPIFVNVARNQDGTPDLSRDARSAPCVLWFDLVDLPDRPFYTIEASHRGASTFSRDELITSDWTIRMSLGR